MFIIWAIIMNIMIICSWANGLPPEAKKPGKNPLLRLRAPTLGLETVPGALGGVFWPWRMPMVIAGVPPCGKKDGKNAMG
ncbi:MAG: hypothetical protein AB7P76_04050 [Candidatus Melainabacteria bacterium]